MLWTKLRSRRHHTMLLKWLDILERLLLNTYIGAKSHRMFLMNKVSVRSRAA